MHEVFKSLLPRYWDIDYQFLLEVKVLFSDLLREGKKTFKFCSKINEGLGANPLYYSTSDRNSRFLKNWSEIQTVIISHTYLSKNTWGAKI